MKKVIIDGVLRREKYCSGRQGSSSATQPQFMNQDQHRHYGDINAAPVAPDCCRNHYSTSSQFGTAFGHATAPRSACSQGSVFNDEARCGGHATPRHHGTSNSRFHGTSGHHYSSSNIGHHATPNTSGNDMGHHHASS